MIRAIIFLSTLLFASLAFSQTPPSRFQNNAQVQILFETHSAATSLCRMLTGLPNRWGCANSELIIVPNPCLYRDQYATLLCHELGHVNGWTHR